jgi:ATP-binding cassette subfamily B protein
MLIDDAFPNKDLELFRRLLAAIAALLILAPVFSGVRTYVMSWLGQKVVHDLRTELYRKIHALSLDFYDRRQTGWIMDRVNADTENLRQFITEGLQENVRDATQLVFIIIIMFWMNWPLALLGLVPAPIVTYLVIRFFRRLGPLFHASWRARAALASTLTNVIPGVRVVKAFVQEAREKLRFDGLSRRFMNASVRVGRKRALFEPSTALVNALGAIVIWGVGGYLYITATPFRGKVVEIGTLVAFMMYLGQFNGAIRNLGRMVEQLQRAMTAAQRIFEVLDTRPSIRNPADGAVLPIAQGVIEFDNVSFEYVPGKRVLKNVSFSVRPGEMVGFVGPSGAGKSTSINLLCRFYDVVEGAIRVDGLDIRDVTVESLRAQMGVVLQEPFLFHGSVADNIAYGDPEATSARVVAAAKAANAHEFILQMPDGYDTLVGERGQRLSGGERQRISIARAILKDPRILILDEATSSVDTETEALIREAVERLVQGRTTIAIAHRLSTLRNADRLVVLDQGRLVEIGSHEELMAKEGGLFRRLTDMQTAMNEIVAVGG